MKEALNTLRQFDAYPKYEESGTTGLRVRTTSGGLLSVMCILLAAMLIGHQISLFTTVDIQPEIEVDSTRGEKLIMNFDVSFPYLPCSVLGVDTMDLTGAQQIDVSHNVFKQRLDKNGNQITESFKSDLGVPNATSQQPAVPECGSCYGAHPDETKCCTCAEVQQLYRQKKWKFDPTNVVQCDNKDLYSKVQAQKDEGCRIHGSIKVKKIAGNMHIAPGTSFQESSTHIHGSTSGLGKVNNTHYIKKISFGENFPGQVNPLDDTKNFDEFSNAMIQYFVKVVPTEYVTLEGRKVTTNQYSVTAHTKYIDDPEKGLPGVYFMYDISPVIIRYAEHKRPLAHLLTNICTIVGGVFTAMALIDSFIYRGMRLSKKND